MNLRPVLLAIFLIASLPATAQQTLGIQAGVGWSSFDIDLDNGRYARGPLLNLGAAYERFLTKHLSVGADLLFQQRGSKDPVILYDMNAQPLGTAYFHFRYNYLALPIKVGYTAGRRGFAFGKLGLIPAVLLKAAYAQPAYFNGQEEIYDFTGNCNHFDLGGIAEAGGGFHFSRSFQLFGSLTYQHSVTRILPEPAGGITERYHGWNLNFGLRYELPARKAAAEKK